MAENNLAIQSIWVFLSYARTDSDTADQVETYLKAAGFDVWRDIRRIQNTDVWSEAIHRG